ncbi:MAG: hypothetical protein AMXMBFR84_46470 [Candidatus Hydrogenedentota bacterium]
MRRREFLTAAALAGAMTAGPWVQAQPAKKYKACIIGDTNDGGYGHSMNLAFALREDVAVVGLADPDEAGRTKMAAECGAERTYSDYREMLEKEKPDLVAVGPRTPGRHKEYLLACAAAGAHGFMEKPISVDVAEADEMIAAIDAKKLKWAIAFNMRVIPPMEHLRKALHQDRIIGSLLEARGRGKEDGRAGGEDLIVLGTHILDLMRYFLGNPEWCFADFTTNGKASTPADIKEASEPLGPIVGNRMHAVYGFPVGVGGHFSSMASKDGGGGRWGLDLYGTQGIVSIRTEAEPVIKYTKDPRWSAGISGAAWEPVPGMPEFKITDQATERHKYIVADLIAAIEADRPPVSSLADGRASLEMIQAAFESQVSGAKAAIPLVKRDHPLKRWKA